MAYTGKRNERKIYYANPTEPTAVVDEDGNRTGEYTQHYGNPIEFWCNVSEAKSRSDRLGSTTYIDPYGLELGYNKVLVTSDQTCGISDASILWVDRMAEPDETGKATVPYDYIVVQCKIGLNNNQYAIKKVEVS